MSEIIVVGHIGDLSHIKEPANYRWTFEKQWHVVDSISITPIHDPYIPKIEIREFVRKSGKELRRERRKQLRNKK